MKLAFNQAKTYMFKAILFFKTSGNSKFRPYAQNVMNDCRQSIAEKILKEEEGFVQCNEFIG